MSKSHFSHVNGTVLREKFSQSLACFCIRLQKYRHHLIFLIKDLIAKYINSVFLPVPGSQTGDDGKFQPCYPGIIMHISSSTRNVFTGVVNGTTVTISLFIKRILPENLLRYLCGRIHAP